MRLAVIIPAYNEEGRVGSSVEKIKKLFPSSLVFISNDGSVDKTAEEAKKAGAIVVGSAVNRGKGAAVRHGMLEAIKTDAELFLFSDCDLSFPPEDWEKLLRPIRNGEADITIGSRWLKESRVEGRSLIRTLSSFVFAFLVRRLTGLPYRDFQCGCKVFTREAARHLFTQPFRHERFSFDVELLLRAESIFVVKEIPVYWRAGKDSKVNMIRDSLRMFRELLDIAKVYYSSH